MGFRPLRRGDRAVIRFCQVGGGSSSLPACPPSSDLSAPLCGAVPACQLIWPQSSPARGGSGPPGVERGWGPSDKQAPSLCAEEGAGGGAGFAPDAWGVAGWQRGRGGLCALRGSTRAWVVAAPGSWGWMGATGWEPRASRQPSPGLSLPSRRRDPGAGFRVTAWVCWAPGSLNETANLPARDYIKESPPPAAPGA